MLAETLGSMGRPARREGGIAVGLDINATHHRAVRSGLVTAEATALSWAHPRLYDVAITDEDGRVLHLPDHLPDPREGAGRLASSASEVARVTRG